MVHGAELKLGSCWVPVGGFWVLGQQKGCFDPRIPAWGLRGSFPQLCGCRRGWCQPRLHQQAPGRLLSSPLISSAMPGCLVGTSPTSSCFNLKVLPKRVQSPRDPSFILQQGLPVLETSFWDRSRFPSAV